MPNWGQGTQGAMGGAMAGSFGGPVGMGIGAAVGGVLGLFGGGGEDPNKRYRQMLEEYSRRQATQMGPAAQAGNSSLMGNRSSLVAQLEAMARGEGPSAAAIQMREAMDRAAGAQASAASGAGGRGVNAGAAMRNAQNNTAAITAQGARDTATLRAQEQMSAIGQLGGVIGQGIATDNQHSQFNTGQLNQHQIENLRAIGIHNQQQLNAIISAMGGTQAPQPGMGTQILAGGANAFMPGLQHWQGQNKPGGVPMIGAQPGTAGWASSPMGRAQAAQMSGTHGSPNGFNWNGPPPTYPDFPFNR